MKDKEELLRTLRRIDGRGYKAYKDIKGIYDFNRYALDIDYVQPDPFAPPSAMCIRIKHETARFPEKLFGNSTRKTALEDYLARRFYASIKKVCKGHRGTGGSGRVAIDAPSQEVMKRSAVVIFDDRIEVRFAVGLPAHGRTITSGQARAILFDEVPELVESSLIYANLNGDKIERFVETIEDAEYVRDNLAGKGLIAFIANGSILPRVSGIDDRPMRDGRVIPFQSPPSLEVEFDLPNSGPIRGLGIKRGITLVVGGGYHGKSTLLNALEKGVYNHIPADGREFVISDYTSVKIRAEDGRNIEKVDISPFINNLPFGQDTRTFSSTDASGSTSQAANIIEALEVGANVLLIDEDTSATNFMIRDGRMQRLVVKDKEPITPFIDKVAQLYGDMGVSTILVMGGAGDYFEVADTVIMMDEYAPRDVTAQAKEIAESQYIHRTYEGGESFGRVTPRRPSPGSIDPSKGKKEARISAKGLHTIAFGHSFIYLQQVEQIVDISQTKAIGDAIYYCKRKYIDGKRTMSEIAEAVEKDFNEKGLDILSPHVRGDYAMPRRFEIAAALNRLRTLKCTI
ncbi:MAG: ABC-ATPase domain-containing protein [Candidatus Tritonobacter lacicola]|nr:ABC-ATPase domain-containing protein [Candidatus Tritonobacter lacicola]